MRKLAFATIAALLLGTGMMAPKAEAACWWNGYGWSCSHTHYYGYWRGGSRWCAFHPYSCR